MLKNEEVCTNLLLHSNFSGLGYDLQLRLRIAEICHFDINSIGKIRRRNNDAIGIAFPLVLLALFACFISEQIPEVVNPLLNYVAKKIIWKPFGTVNFFSSIVYRL